MIESGDALATWRLESPPPVGAQPVRATQIGEHRKAYLSYEGPVSGDRGHVTRIDEGRVYVHRKTADEWAVSFEGRLLRGDYRLVRMPSQPSSSWSLTSSQPGSLGRRGSA